jgi:hypothetical protein
MMTLAADLEHSRISIGDWSRGTDWIKPEHGGWQAQLGLRSGRSLHLEWHDGDAVYVSLWSGEAHASPGAAVLVAREDLAGIRTIPVCECGEQGCADASFQFRGPFRVDDIPDLVRMLDGLPPTTTQLGDSNFWRPVAWDEFTPRAEWPDQARR